MIPSRRVYGLLLLGIAIAILIAILISPQVSIISTLVFDSVVIGLAIWDGQRVKPHAVTVTRYPLQRLSIGRDNPVVLSVRSGNRASKIRLRDYYPLEFKVSTATLEASLEANSSQ